MLTLSSSSFGNARQFLLTHARDLEVARFRYEFENGTAEEVVDELEKFQNSDGGFGRSLEPDCRLAESSGLATSVALQMMRTLPRTATYRLAKSTMRWLVDRYDRTENAWSIVPPAVNDVPRAPWWNYTNETLSESLGNPSPEMVGYLFDYHEDSLADLRETALAASLAYLDNRPELEMHELLCYLRLLNTENLPVEAKQRIEPKVRSDAKRQVVTDPTQWEGYGLRPLGVANRKESFLLSEFEESVNAELDTLIGGQGADGAWAPTWSWFGGYSDVWPTAEREWKGVLTLENLLALRSFGRLSS